MVAKELVGNLTEDQIIKSFKLTGSRLANNYIISNDDFNFFFAYWIHALYTFHINCPAQALMSEQHRTQKVFTWRSLSMCPIFCKETLETGTKARVNDN